MKELEHNLQRLQSEYQSLTREKEILQKDLNRAEDELVMAKAMVAQQPADILSTVHHEQEEAMASMNRVTELEDMVQVLLEEHQAIVKESENFRKALEGQQRERDTLEQKLIDHVKNDEVDFSQRQVESEQTIMAANIRNETLTDEVNKLRTAFKLVEQANESHQERLELTQIEVTKLEELLDEATMLLTEAMEQKDSLQRSLSSTPGDSATKECQCCECDAQWQEE
jgi:chromosome segregation ATPase